MKNVEIKKAEILDKIEHNRTEHIRKYEEALNIWKIKLKERLNHSLAEFEKDVYPKRVLEIVSDLVRPTSYEQSYSDALEMLNMDVRETVTLSSEEFKKYIQDNWEWKNSWEVINSSYSPSFRNLDSDE